MDELTITEADLRGWEPCCDDDQLAEALAGVTFPISARGVLVLDGIPADDLLWVVLRPEMLTDRQLREFACDCAERAMEQHGNGDERSLAAIEVARRFARGQANKADLTAAAGAARDARDAAWAAARDARGAAARAAGDAAWAAARAAGDAAAGAAGDAAAWAAWDAEWAAAWAARDAAWDAGAAAESERQVARLAEVLGHG